MATGRVHQLTIAAMAFLAQLAVATVVYAALWAIDFGGIPDAPSPLALLREPGTAQTMAGLGEVTVAIIGIAITVSAIIVELAANRYTPRITELFVRDPVNVTVLSFMMVTAVMVVWVEMSLYGPAYPEAMVVVTTGMMTASLLLVLPYFAYVFDFLTPTQVVERIQLRTQAAIARAARTSPKRLERVRREVLTGAEQLGDIALNSVEKKDKALAIAAVNALSGVVDASLAHKGGLPEAWFSTAELASEDPDFVAFHPAIVRGLQERRTWLEMKLLRQYQTIFTESLHVMRDVNHLVSIRTCQNALAAAREGDGAALQQMLHFLNTYLRAAINAKDVRTAYNLLNDLRALAESLLDVGHEDRVIEIAERMKFYGQLAFHMHLPFIQVTVAHDLCDLLEQVSARQCACHDDLLQIFLELDRQPEEGRTQEASLRGVRKAQVKLATHYLQRGQAPRARRIFEDMRHEPAGRMRSIYAELAAISDPEYWEVSDRGINFDYIAPERRQPLEQFFAWFEAEWETRAQMP